MAAKRVIVALDVQDGRVVKGVKFRGFKDVGDLAELAVFYGKEGADAICLLDITATIEGRAAMEDVVARACEATSTPIMVGGGISDVSVMETMIQLGAAKVCLNSAAVADPQLIQRGAEAVGSGAIVLSIDCARHRDDSGRVWWEVVTRGGRTPTGKDVVAWAQQGVELGAGEIVLNSIDTDGVRDGYDNELNAAVTSKVNVPVVASGGAGQLQHLVDGILQGGVDGVLAASIFHFGEHTISEAKAYMSAHGIKVNN